MLLGSLTTTGSWIAAAKTAGDHARQHAHPGLQGAEQPSTSLLLFVALGAFIYVLAVPGATVAFYLMLAIAFVFGLMLVLPIAAADMPVVMSLLNSYAGLAAAATGFAISNNVLIIAGTLNGFSGFMLSMLMCKAMNRSFTNVLFGAFGSVFGNGDGVQQTGEMRRRQLRRMWRRN